MTLKVLYTTNKHKCASASFAEVSLLKWLFPFLWVTDAEKVISIYLGDTKLDITIVSVVRAM